MAYLEVGCPDEGLAKAFANWRKKLLVLVKQADHVGKEPKPTVEQLESRGGWLPYEDLFQVCSPCNVYDIAYMIFVPISRLSRAISAVPAMRLYSYTVILLYLYII